MSEIVFRPIQPADFGRFALPAPTDDSMGWVAEHQAPVAVIVVYPLPGLPDMADFFLFTQPKYRYLGYGSALLEHALHQLLTTPITTLTARFDHARQPGARFLQARGFVVEHVEWEMELRKLKPSPATDVALYALPLDEALPLFRELYDAAFRPNPWYQPWESDADVRSDWAPGDELLFLNDGDEPVGFVWVRHTGRRKAELEPIGVIAQRHGQGFGRKLLVATLNHLAGQRVHTVKLGVWQSNTRAIALYESVGFRRRTSRIYLARAVSPKPV